MAEHKFSIDQTLSSLHLGDFLPREERHLFNMVPEPVVYGDLNPNYTGLLFLDSGLEKPDLASLFLDSVPEEVKSRVLLTMEKCHTRSCERM